MDEVLKPGKKDYYFKILITECVFVAIVLLTLITVKFCDKAEYKKLKEIFNREYYSTTDSNEVLEEML